MRDPFGRALSWAGVLVAVGAFVFIVALAHVWRDIDAAGVSPVVVLAENALSIVFALALIAAGVALPSLDWSVDYVRNTVFWSLGSGVALLCLHGYLLATRAMSSHELPATVVATTTLVIGSTLGLGIGVYSSQVERKRAAVETERDQFSSLFENTTDCVVLVEYDGATPLIRDANAAFEETFGYDPARVTGESLTDLVVPDETDHETGGQSSAELVARARNGESLEAEGERETASGVRDFLIRAIPLESYDYGRAYVVYTDITERKRLHQAIADRERVEYLHRVASELADVVSRDALYARVLDAAEDSLDFACAALVFDGETVAARNTDAPLATGDVETAVDGGDLVRSRTDGRDVLTVPVADRGAFQVARDDGEFDDRDVSVAELLATHLGATLDRLEREERVQTERERLEFTNRALRHNLLNGLNVAKARTDLIVDTAEGAAEEHARVVGNRAAEMADLVETMRTYTNALVDAESHELYPVSLADALREEVVDAQEAYPAVEFELDDVPDVDVRADSLLGTVFEQFLSNAAQHNDSETPRVRVSASTDEDGVTVRVSDNGPGLDGDTAVFEKGLDGLRQPGRGFGLYLVKEIANVYGGCVGVEDAPDGGASFWVRLPRA